jgi:hypothetical protein
MVDLDESAGVLNVSQPWRPALDKAQEKMQLSSKTL